MFLRVVLLLYIIICYAQVSNTLECASKNSTIFKLAVNSYRNISGHWNAQIQVGHGSEQDDIEMLNFEVEHITTKCPNTEYVLVVANITASQFSRPESGYELIRGLGYYKLHTVPQNWYTARVICHQEGGYLAIINSEFEFSVMKMLFDRHPKIVDNEWSNKNFFLGISDLESPKNFVTIFGLPVNDTGYPKWHAGSPNYDGNCIAVLRSGLIHDTSCHQEFPFFCEKKL